MFGLLCVCGVNKEEVEKLVCELLVKVGLVECVYYYFFEFFGG